MNLSSQSLSYTGSSSCQAFTATQIGTHCIPAPFLTVAPVRSDFNSIHAHNEPPWLGGHGFKSYGWHEKDRIFHPGKNSNSFPPRKCFFFLLQPTWSPCGLFNAACIIYSNNYWRLLDTYKSMVTTGIGRFKLFLNGPVIPNGRWHMFSVIFMW